MRQIIDIRIGEITEFFKQNQAMYKDVLAPLLHRGKKFGVKFLLPEHCVAARDRDLSDANHPTLSTYQLNINGKMVSYPTQDQMKWIDMEVQIRWLRILSGYKMKLKYEEMLSSQDFGALIEQYGEGEELLKNYSKGLDFAPDRETYIRKRIQNFESVMPKFKSSIEIWDRQYKNRIRVETGEYRRIGFAWVNNGHNALPEDLKSLTFYNATLCHGVPEEDRYSVYVQVLHHLAAGGSIAFHIAFLREQLKKPAIIKKKKTPDPSVWQGTEDQRVKLFEALVSESFIQDTGKNRVNFMKNRYIRWKQDGRSLFYLLELLKGKKYKLLDRLQPLGPVIKNNFTNKNGDPFKNISQNKSGMFNGTKTSKPRTGTIIEKILQKVFEI